MTAQPSRRSAVSPRTCPACDGDGEVSVLGGDPRDLYECAVCEGTGEICGDCGMPARDCDC